MHINSTATAISEVTHAAEKRMAMEALRAELNAGKNSQGDRIRALEEEVRRTMRLVKITVLHQPYRVTLVVAKKLL